jgi:outer membrane protein assembly factor BamA
VALCAFFVATPVFGQSSLPESPSAGLPTTHETKLGFTQGSFFAAPIPSESPTFGTGLALGGGYLFQADEMSKTSFIGGGAYKTSNGSQGYGFATSVAFDSNRWQATVFAGELEVFYDLFILGEPIPIKQEGQLVDVQLRYGFTPQMSLGLGARYLETTVEAQTGLDLPDIIDRDTGLSILSYGILADWDRRDDSIYPTSGSNLAFSAYQNEIENSGRDYQKAVLLADYYTSVFSRGVIAARLAGCTATDGTPFFDLCSLGGTDAFRGFSITQNLGEDLLSLQVAYRGLIGERFGYAVFMGAGQVTTRLSAVEGDKTRYAGGIGARYRLTEKFPLDFSVDVSINDESEEFVYIYVGQRF